MSYKRKNSDIILSLLLLICSGCVFGQSIDTTVSPTIIKKDDIVTLTSVIKNTLKVQSPIVFNVALDYNDEYGIAKTITSSCDLTVVRPIKIKEYKWTIPLLFDYVIDTTKINDILVTPIITGMDVVLVINQTLNEEEELTVTFNLKAKQV